MVEPTLPKKASKKRELAMVGIAFIIIVTFIGAGVGIGVLVGGAVGAVVVTSAFVIISLYLVDKIAKKLGLKFLEDMA